MFNVDGVHNLGIDHFEKDDCLDDVLHTVDLGFGQRYCGESIKLALRNYIFGLPHATLYQRLLYGIISIRRYAAAFRKINKKAGDGPMAPKGSEKRQWAKGSRRQRNAAAG